MRLAVAHGAAAVAVAALGAAAAMIHVLCARPELVQKAMGLIGVCAGPGGGTRAPGGPDGWL